MKPLTGLLMLLFFYSFSYGQMKMDGKNYFWVNSNEISWAHPEKSIIEFKENVVIIIDYPRNGSLSYQLGKYKFDSENLTIECKIKKTLFISSSIGNIYKCSENCKPTILLEISEEGDLKRNTDRFNSNKLILNKKQGKYKAFDIANPPFTYDWVHEYIRKKNRKRFFFRRN